MKKLIMIAAMLLSAAAMAQTSGISTNAQMGTYLWVIIEKDPFVERLLVNYGETADLGQVMEVSNLPELEVQAIEGQTVDTATETAYVIPLLATNTPFSLGQTVFISVQGAYLMNGQLAETSTASEVIEAFLLGRPKAPKRIGIIKK